MQLLLYNFIIHLYHLSIRIVALFQPKARLWLSGRKHIFDKLETAFIPTSNPVIWMHCASLGEFEQGRPILESLRKDYPDYQLLLTFFSPSGYAIRKDYQGVDHVFYLPIDSQRNARRFINIVKPKLVIFVKYEFWYHFLNQLSQQKIPCFLISALFRDNQLFFRRYGALYRKMLTFFTHIFVQTSASQKLLTEQLGLQQISIVGDTRVDRVMAIANQPQQYPLIEAFAKGAPVLVCGSTWPPDEEILCTFINQHTGNWKFIIAPHEIGNAHVQAIHQQLEVPSQRYSQLDASKMEQAKVLVIDNVGMLSSLYAHARLAYVGGGFGKNIHNILEPAAFGIPVIFGPNHHNFIEALELGTRGGGFVINDLSSFKQIFNTLCKNQSYQTACEVTQAFIRQQQGATDQIMKYLERHLG